MPSAKLTRPAPMPSVVKRLRNAAADPMQANHAEVSKNTLSDAAYVIESLITELCHAQMEASCACAELSSLALHGDTTYAVRDSKAAVHTLVELQRRITEFVDASAAR